MVRFVLKNIDQKEMCSNEVGQCPQTKANMHGLIVNIIVRVFVNTKRKTHSLLQSPLTFSFNFDCKTSKPETTINARLLQM